MDEVDNFRHEEWSDPDLKYTYAMVLPWDYQDDRVLGNCMDDPKYDIMKVLIPDESEYDIYVKPGMWNTHLIPFEVGQEIRPLIWTNPKSWGATAFFMNPTLYPAEAYLGDENAGPFSFYEVVANSFRHHVLPGYVDISDESYYYCDGIRLDAYQQDPVRYWVNRNGQILHGEIADLNLNGEPDCDTGDCDDPEALEVIQSVIDGYEFFLQDLRRYVGEKRPGNIEFSIISNGHPLEQHWEEVNGREFEDTDNWGFQEQSWQEVIDNCLIYYENELDINLFPIQ